VVDPPQGTPPNSILARGGLLWLRGPPRFRYNTARRRSLGAARPAVVRPILPLLALVVAALACSEVKPAPAPPTTFCKDGERVCKGNNVAECTGGGKAYKVTFCGAKSCSGGECKDPVCAKGQLTCTEGAVYRCPDDGLSDAAKIATCKTTNPAEKCNDGVCLPNACIKGDATKPADARCGDKTLFQCITGVWKATTCGSSQYCDTTAGGACKDRACTPTQARCKDAKTAQTCTLNGSGWTDEACASGQRCDDGVCHLDVGGGTVADGGSTGTDASAAAPGDAGDSVSIGTGDTLVKPKKDVTFDAPDVFKVTFSKTKTPGAGDTVIKMDFPAASYLPVLKALQISGDKDLFKVELQVGPIDDFATGTYSQTGGQAGETKIYANDGTNDQRRVQWLWAAADYDIELTTFEDIGGRVQGKFSAELIHTVDKKTKAYLVGGEFDIKRN